MSDSESDIEMKSALSKKMPKKPVPRSPSEDLKTKKITTKMMIVDALIELKTRKGVSLYAIKKYLTEKYNVNTEKVNYLIKKSIKAGVEDGTFVQMKGIGASGSFKLANIKEKPKAKKKTKKLEKTAKPEKPDTKTDEKESKTQKSKELKQKKVAIKKIDKKESKTQKSDELKPKKVAIKKKEGEEKKKKDKLPAENPEKTKEVKPKKSKAKIAKGMPTPSKKRAAIMKRKSIGSIIKPPKMKPTK